jgi:hypothetical protein
MSKKVYRKEKDCLNCGAYVAEHYCPHCGQANIELHVPVWSFSVHLLADFFHFDSKFFRTLLPLVAKPGFLTKEFLSGHRRSYLDPIRLYIFVSVIYFALAFTGSDPASAETKPISGAIAVPADSLRISKYEFEINGSREDTTWLERRFQQKLAEAGGDGGQYKEQVLNTFMNTLPKLMFILLPLFALIVKLFYFRRHYVDHALLSLHVHTAAFMALIADELFDKAGFTDFTWIAALYIMVYFFISLRNVYARSYRFTLFAWTGIGLIYMICVSVLMIAGILATALI